MEEGIVYKLVAAEGNKWENTGNLVSVCSSHKPIGPQSYPVIHAVASSPVRDLLDRKRSKEHLQRSNESIKTKTRQKQQKKQMPKRMLLLGRMQRRAGNSYNENGCMAHARTRLT